MNFEILPYCSDRQRNDIFALNGLEKEVNGASKINFGIFHGAPLG